MPPASPLQPTLWRTCRVLANPTRLELLASLFRQTGQTVSALAAHTEQSLPLTSEYLRMLEARGLLTVRRTGRRVKYNPGSTAADNRLGGLLAALRATLRSKGDPQQTVFKLATAFTHPRRVEIFRALSVQPQTLGELHTATGIPSRALHRHLWKLEARDFIRSESGCFRAMDRPDALGRELVRLALG